MAWNEPGGGKRDPWQGKKPQPDMEDMLRRLREGVGRLFGGGSGGGGPAGSGGFLLIIAAAVLVWIAFDCWLSVDDQRVRRRAVRTLQKHVTVLTCAEWEDSLPGDIEAYLVSHAGDSATGSFVHTLTLTDVASGWTECVALVVRDGALQDVFG